MLISTLLEQKLKPDVVDDTDLNDIYEGFFNGSANKCHIRRTTTTAGIITKKYPFGRFDFAFSWALRATYTDWRHRDFPPEVYLIVVFDDIANVPVTNPASAADWNNYSGLPSAGTPFYAVIVSGNTVTLYGNEALETINTLIAAAHVVSVTDTGGTVYYPPMGFYDVFLIPDGSGTAVSYDPSTGISTNRIPYTLTSGTDSANTDTRFWASNYANPAKILEYTITLNPFSYSFNRQLTFAGRTGNGLELYSADNGLNKYVFFGNDYNTNEVALFTFDNSTVGTKSILFYLPSTRYVTGDFLYNPSAQTVTITSTITGTDERYISTYDMSGNLIAEIEYDMSGLMIGKAGGLFNYLGELHVVTYEGANTYIYKLTYPSTVVLIQTLAGQFWVGASQNNQEQ